jgi:uncharacterized caspase-like protein
MNRFCFLLIFTVYLLPVSAQEKRLALLIGNADYKEISILSNPVNDVTAMSELLNNLGFDVILSSNLSQVEMKKKIDEFGSRLNNYKVGLFFYSGHGVQYKGENYLIPVDANIENEQDIEYNCVNAGRILANMEKTNSMTNIIIFDACRNNPFKKSWTRAVEDNGLAFMEAPAGSIIAYSTAPGQTASDGDGKYGLYTESLLQKMGNPSYNILQVFQEVRKIVKEKSGGMQIPWESTSLESDFYFNQSYKEIAIAQGSSSDFEEKEISDKSVIASAEDIKNNPDYIWTEGSGKSVEEADKIAKDEFIKKLASNFSGGSQITGNVPDKKTSNGTIKYIEELIPVMARRVYEVDNKYVSLRYLPYNEMHKEFEQKKAKINSMFESGLASEKKQEIGDAIKYLYWTCALRSGFPVDANDSTDKDLISMSSVESQLNSILGKVKIFIADSSSFQSLKRYKIEFHYNDNIIPYIGYQYWTGVSWSDLNTTSDGVGYIDLYYDIPVSQLQIKLEFKYLNNTTYDKFLNYMVSNFDRSELETKAIMNVGKKEIEEQTIKKPFVSERYAPVVHKLISYVKQRNETFDKELFTQEGFDVYRQLLLYGNASFFQSEPAYQTFSTPYFTYVRGIDVKFKFPNSKSEFIETLSLEIDKESRINNITFSLDQKAVVDVLSQRRWPEQSKWHIINFLENYKTAYALKRYDYINKIFSDNALIITGKRIEESTKPDDNVYSHMGKNYSLTKYTKDQYMSRIKRVFDNNEFINIRFEDNLIKKRDGQSDVYGINIKQNYFSSNYSDQGYLFLMVDIKENAYPVIYVRAWQPDKFEDGHIIGLSDFTY